MAFSSAFSEVETILNKSLWPIAQTLNSLNTERDYLDAQKRGRPLTPDESLALGHANRTVTIQQLAFLREKATLVTKINHLTDADKNLMANGWGSKLRQCEVVIPGFDLVIDEPARHLLLFSDGFLDFVKFLDTQFDPVHSDLLKLRDELANSSSIVRANNRRANRHRADLESRINALQLEEIRLRREGIRRFELLTEGEIEILYATREEDLGRYGFPFQRTDAAYVPGHNV